MRGKMRNKIVKVFFTGRPWMGTWYGLGGIVMGILFLILIAVVIYVLVKGSGFNIRDLNKSETALEILRKRYARGEITKEEYDDMRKELN